MLLFTLPAGLTPHQGHSDSPPAGRGKGGTSKPRCIAASIYSLSWPKPGHAKKAKGLAAICFCLHKVILLKPFQETIISAKLARFHAFLFNFPLKGILSKTKSWFFFQKKRCLTEQEHGTAIQKLDSTVKVQLGLQNIQKVRNPGNTGYKWEELKARGV